MFEEFKDIKFIDNNHTYWREGKQLPSFSSLLSKLHEEFDADTIIPKYAKKFKFTPKQVASAWNTQNKKETNEGSRVHNFAELYVTQHYINGLESDKCILPQSSQDLGVISWWNNYGSKFNIAAIELVMGNEVFAGTTDIVLEDNNELYLVDWKSNKDIFKDSFGKKLAYPFDFLEATPYNKYQIQLSAYQLLLEGAGYKVKDRVLVWLNKQGSDLYQQFHLEDYSELFNTYLNEVYIPNQELLKEV